MPTVVCVLKKGGTYTPEYVQRLKKGVENNTTIGYNFVCLTDDESVSGICEVKLLKHRWDGWWSKIELFNPEMELDNTVYVDLDTVILGNIDELLKLAVCKPCSFIPLRGFNQKITKLGEENLATGVMVADFPPLSFYMLRQGFWHQVFSQRSFWCRGEPGLGLAM